MLVVVLLVFASAGIYSAHRTLERARRHAKTDAAFQAGVAGRALADTLTLAATQIGNVTTNAGIAAALGAPTNAKCSLTFSDMAFFPGGHLDLVLPDGQVTCSSLVGKDRATHAEAPWLAQVLSAKAPIVSAPFVDSMTGRSAIVVAAPVYSPAGAAGKDTKPHAIGAVVVVAPVGGMAEGLAGTYGGPQHYEFAVRDASGRALSVPPRPARHTISGSRAVPSTGWSVVAAVRSSTALGPTRSVLATEGALGAAALILTLVLLTLVQRRIARPLARLTSAVGTVGQPGAAVAAAVGGPAEVVRLASEFDEAITARDAYEHQLSHQALHDPLTGLPNRALLADRLLHALDQAARIGEMVAVLVIDLDEFKIVNDSLGHAAGDHVLTTMAARLTDAIRPGDTLTRFGADEFVVVCESIVDVDEAIAVARRIGDVVGERCEAGDRAITVTASVGIALGGAGRNAEDLIREADTAMYRAKELGRARYEVYTDELRERVTKRLVIENELRTALERDELQVVYQPKVELATGHVLGVEALLRWDHPALGAVSPLTFIPIAEESGLITPIGTYVLERACRQAAAWRDEGLDLTMAVNVSARQMSDPALPGVVARVLAETGLDPHLLCLELTESVMSDVVRATGVLDAVKALGVSISIDDVGTGYSSLAYLKLFPVDELKVDRSFVNDITTRPEQRTLVAAMVAMAHALGISVVAEGVETAEQASELRALGCEVAQGYLFAHPESPSSLHAMLRGASVRTATLPA
jgi:diguanylate cyclase (GGDEF)-like protein